MINLVRQQVYRTFKNSNFKKINHSIEYLGCDADTLKEHFKKKMAPEMTFDNIHIDHIKPVSKNPVKDFCWWDLDGRASKNNYRVFCPDRDGDKYYLR
jgi:hypothetical protein